jgi:hypothetical protein
MRTHADGGDAAAAFTTRIRIVDKIEALLCGTALC